MKRLLLLLSLALVLIPGRVMSQQAAAPTATTTTPATAPAAAPAFNVDSATTWWLNQLPPDKRAKSDAYFEGGYWIQLWSFVIQAVILWALLHFGWSARIRDWAELRTARPWLQVTLYWMVF